jgi:integrase
MQRSHGGAMQMLGLEEQERKIHLDTPEAKKHIFHKATEMNRATDFEIAEVLGHRTLQMVKRYSHLADSHTAKVVESMTKKIFGELQTSRLKQGRS